jgi:glycosyltransferase involved in cell wall biosynthesis
LHNIHGGYFKTSLIKELSKYAPIVWTLHDMWAFTANAAYTLGDDSWKSLKAGPSERKYFPQIGINTGSWLLKNKKQIYENSNLTIVCPSKWLYGLAKQSPVFSNNPIHSIANGIDLELFKPHEKDKVRNKLNIPIDAKVISFVAEKIYQSQFKGGKNLISILKGINENTTEKIHVIMIGQGSHLELLDLTKLVIHSTGYVNSDELISKYLSASDIFIFPTLADNLPNTLIEACACGVPCVTFDIGGCGEIVENDFNGLLIKPFDVKKFVEKTLYLLENTEKQKVFSQNCLIKVTNEYSIQKMSKNYDKLFQELLIV